MRLTNKTSDVNTRVKAYLYHMILHDSLCATAISDYKKGNMDKKITFPELDSISFHHSWSVTVKEFIEGVRAYMSDREKKIIVPLVEETAKKKVKKKASARKVRSKVSRKRKTNGSQKRSS